MKLQSFLLVILTSFFVAGCATTTNNTPSLSGQMRPTQAVASPSDFQSNDLNASSNMLPPSRPSY